MRTRKAMAILFWFFLALSWTTSASAQPPPLPAAQLVASFEDLLGRQAMLLHSFESLLGPFKIPPVELLKGYEDLLHRQVKLLESYEDLTQPFACTPGMPPHLPLVASFGKLLHGQVKLLVSFEALIQRHPMLPIGLAERFAGLLEHQAGLLQSLEGLLRCLSEVHSLSPRMLFPLLGGFEALLRAQAGLLGSFEELIRSGRAPQMGVLPMLPMGPDLPSPEQLRDFAFGSQRRELLPDLIAWIERFKQEALRMRTHGQFLEAQRREAQLAELRRFLLELQGEILNRSLVVMPQVGRSGLIAVMNQGPFQIHMATVLIYRGSQVVFRQSLQTLEPGAYRLLRVILPELATTEVRVVATGFVEFITKLMRATMDL